MDEILWNDYVLQQNHENYLAGTKCKAYRNKNTNKLIFKFDDGNELILDGSKFYLKDIDIKNINYSIDIIEILTNKACLEITSTVDKECLEMLTNK
jgi:hypothetical protein